MSAAMQSIAARAQSMPILKSHARFIPAASKRRITAFILAKSKCKQLSDAQQSWSTKGLA
jgi:hypothetical protein